MDKKPVYSIFPGVPKSPTASTNSRQSTDQPPCPPPSTPLSPLPQSRSHPNPTTGHKNSFAQGPPPTSDPLASPPPSSRRRPSPNRELADFHRSLARQPIPPPQPSSLQQTRQKPPPQESTYRLDRSDHPAHQDSAMYYSALSTSSSSSLSMSKPPVLSSTSTSPAQTPSPSHSASHPRAQRPNTVYFHGGIGGAGNYRKVIRENNKAPRAYAENAEPRRRPSPTRFLSKVFGGQKGQGPGSAPSGPIVDARVNGSDINVKEEVSLGAAEVLRRKMIGGSRRKRAGS